MLCTHRDRHDSPSDPDGLLVVVVVDDGTACGSAQHVPQNIVSGSNATPGGDGGGGGGSGVVISADAACDRRAKDGGMTHCARTLCTRRLAVELWIDRFHARERLPLCWLCRVCRRCRMQRVFVVDWMETTNNHLVVALRQRMSFVRIETMKNKIFMVYV